MAGNLEFKWHVTDGLRLRTEVEEVVDVEDHEAEAETVDVRVLGPVVGRAAVTEIAGALTAVVAVALVPTARALVENHVLAANLRTGKKTVVPSQGTEVERVCNGGRESMNA
jgi:hypothetical protein